MIESIWGNLSLGESKHLYETSNSHKKPTCRSMVELGDSPMPTSIDLRMVRSILEGKLGLGSIAKHSYSKMWSGERIVSRPQDVLSVEVGKVQGLERYDVLNVTSITGGSLVTWEILWIYGVGKLNVPIRYGYNPMPTFTKSFMELLTIKMLGSGYTELLQQYDN